VKLLREGVPLVGAEEASGQHPLGGGLGEIVALDDPAADAALTDELADGAEEVELQPEQTIEALQDGEGGAGARAVVAHEPADDEAVALLDPGLIVLAIRAAAREANALPAAPGQQAVVDEFAAVVAGPLAQGKGQSPGWPR